MFAPVSLATPDQPVNVVPGCVWRSSSKLLKKKSLFRMIGPPNETPTSRYSNVPGLNRLFPACRPTKKPLLLRVWQQRLYRLGFLQQPQQQRLLSRAARGEQPVQPRHVRVPGRRSLVGWADHSEQALLLQQLRRRSPDAAGHDIHGLVGSCQRYGSEHHARAALRSRFAEQLSAEQFQLQSGSLRRVRLQGPLDEIHRAPRLQPE